MTAASTTTARQDVRGTIAHRLAAVVLCLHGVVHLLGFLSAWRLAEIEELP
jgi:succinate dehydrogenase hydrophobic anchor subunit